MALITFETKNKTQSSADFPKFKLAKGERARVAILENPQFGYVHDLRKPKIVNGKAEMKLVERKDGTTFSAPVMDFVSRSRCTGDEDVLAESGIDPKHCSICNLAKENSAMADAPKRRFALHVVKYNTKPGSFDLVDGPFSVQIQVWPFTDMVFNKMIEINSIVGSLQSHDLLLGPCTDPVFQKFDINYDVKALWSGDASYKETTLSSLKSNRADDLMYFVGRNTEQRFIDKNIEDVREAHRVLNGRGEEPQLAAKEVPQLSEGLGSLLDETKPAEPSFTANSAKEDKKEEPKAGGFDTLLDL